MTESTDGIVPAYTEINSPAYALYYANQQEIEKNLLKYKYRLL